MSYAAPGPDAMDEVPMLDIVCEAGGQPALLHLFVGVFDEGAFNESTVEATSDEFMAVLANTERIVALTDSGVSTAEDASPTSPETVVRFAAL